MMKLPNKFQFRVGHIPGFTHTISKNAHGDYEVSWARGYPNKIRSVPRVVFEEYEVQERVDMGGWVVVDDKPNQDESNSTSSLPDEFYFEHKNGRYSGKACREAYGWTVTWGKDWQNSFYHENWISYFINRGMWIIVEKKPLTPEQQRQLNDFKERVAALEQSIKLNEQDVEHKKRLISNYESTKQDLLKKIEEMV